MHFGVLSELVRAGVKVLNVLLNSDALKNSSDPIQICYKEVLLIRTLFGSNKIIVVRT